MDRAQLRALLSAISSIPLAAFAISCSASTAAVFSRLRTRPRPHERQFDDTCKGFTIANAQGFSSRKQYKAHPTLSVADALLQGFTMSSACVGSLARGFLSPSAACAVHGP